MLLGNVLDIGTPSDGTVTNAKLAQDIISGETALAVAPADTDEFLVSDAGTLKRIDYSLIKPTNTPAFSAHMAADQSSLGDSAYVKLTMETEFFDSDGKYDTSTQRFTPTVAGKYMFGCSVYIEATNTMETGIIAFYKNGSNLLYASQNVDGDNKFQLTGVIDLDADDYVELYGYVDVASSGTWEVNMNGTTADNRTYWYGYKLIT
jgi:hypothetical protein